MTILDKAALEKALDAAYSRPGVIDIIGAIEAYLTALSAENERLREDFRDCIRVDATMGGPVFMGFNISALNRLRRAWFPEIKDSPPTGAARTAELEREQK